MSAADVDTTRVIYDAINRADAETVLAHFSHDIVVHEPPGLPYGGTYTGMVRFGELLGLLNAFWEGLRLEPDEILDADPCVIIRGRIVATVKPTGREVEQPYLELLRFRDGKAVEAWVQMDTAAVLGPTLTTRQEADE
jgi:ketosteroid isomerase-like protein